MGYYRSSAFLTPAMIVLLAGSMWPDMAFARPFNGLELDRVAKIVSGIQMREATSVAPAVRPIETAATNADPEIIAARVIEANRFNPTSGSIQSLTVGDVEAATSLLDLEPTVISFHEKMKGLLAPPSSGGRLSRGRIYRGKEIGGFDRVVLLLDRNYKFVCTGTFIKSNFILTATHCLCEDGTNFPNREKLKYVAYGRSRAEAKVFDDELVPSKAQWIGTGSVCADSYEDPDIAVVGLPSPMLFGLPAMQFAQDSEIDKVGAELRIVGFGRDPASRSSGNLKRAALVPIVSASCTGEPNATPGRTFASVFECVEGREIVAGNFGDADTCDGDSGGPAFLTFTSNAADAFPDDVPLDELRLAGVTSRGVKTDSDSNVGDCGYGGIYVRVSGEVRKFVEQAIAL